MKQQLALVDCNNFYVSCERVFRPDLKTTPIVVLSNNDGSLIQVHLETDRFRADKPQYAPALSIPLPQPTNDSLIVNKWAAYLIERMYKPEYEYKKAGITLAEISPVSQYQSDWLEPKQATDNRLMDALDALNSRYGRGTVKVSTQGAFSEWQMKQERKSPSYTTDLRHAPTVS